MFLSHRWAMDMNWDSTKPISSAAEASLQQLRSVVAIAGGLVASGRSVDLSGLTSMAGLLCAQILDLPPENGRAFRSSLISIQENLASLSAALTASDP